MKTISKTTSGSPFRSKSLMRLLPVVVVLAASSTAFAKTTPATCQKTDEKQISALFDRWNASLKTQDADKVAANYASDAVLLATVANEPLTTPAAIRGYFQKFLAAGPQGTINKQFIKIGCNIAQDVGTYTFVLNDGTQVKARYTYVYEYQGGEWKIKHHHSSVMPEKA